MESLVRNFRYRPEIDGLRALAVLAVVLFHARIGLRGGFVGVDVFFVISGFLITSLIVKDLSEGRFTLANFWERRVRRIVPAVVVVVLATLIAGWFVIMPDDYVGLGQSAAWQAAFAANFHFWLNTGYFAGLAEEQPLLHTWSLAVEEQFYLFFPLILFGLYRFAALRHRRMLLTVLVVGFLASLALSIHQVPRVPGTAFYLLPARAWELLAGAIVALLHTPALSRAWREALCWLALALILVPCFNYTKHTPFPGLAAFPPCLGTALFIWAARTPTHDSATRPSASRLLASRPVVFVGLVSYSFYLWHWPIFAFAAYMTTDPLPRGYRLAMIALAFILAVLSWRLVETPFRKRRWCATRKSVFIFGASAIAAVAGLGGVLQLASGFPQRLSAEARAYADAKSDFGFLNEVTTEDVLAGRLVPLGMAAAGTPDPPPVTWLVWGDSHAMAAIPAFDAFLTEQGLSGEAATHSATAPAVNFRSPFWTESVRFNDAVLAHVKARRIANVVLVAYWENYKHASMPDLPGAPTFDDSLVETVREIIQAGARPWILLDVPIHNFDVPRDLARRVLNGAPINPKRAMPEPSRTLPGNDPQLVTRLRDAGASIIDPRPAFLSEDGTYYVVAEQGISLYRDSNHLSTRGAKLKLVPVLRKAILGNADQSQR